MSAAKCAFNRNDTKNFCAKVGNGVLRKSHLAGASRVHSIAPFNFGTAEVPDVLDIQVTGGTIGAQDFPGQPITQGQDNTVELQVVVG